MTHHALLEVILMLKKEEIYGKEIKEMERDFELK